MIRQFANWRFFLRRQPHIIVLVLMFIILFVMVSTFLSTEASNTAGSSYAPKYQYQQSYHKYSSRTLHYNISVIADKDKDSKSADGWESTLKNGVLSRDTKTGLYSVEWVNSIPVKSKMNEDGRGMELSDLTYFDNHLYSFDDRTGIAYEVDAEGEQVIARYILVDGNGRTNKGFKCEWSTVKDGLLYVGGLGKEWTNPDGQVKSRDPQFVKTIHSNGLISHVSWVDVYESLRTYAGYQSPGYFIHEAVRFNPDNRRWYFMPRRASRQPYNDVDDEKRGADIVLSMDENFEDVEMFHIGELKESHGFSAFAFVPYREHEVIALKTEELEGNIATYITAFDFDKKEVLMEETIIGNVKFEGIEFV